MKVLNGNFLITHKPLAVARSGNGSGRASARDYLSLFKLRIVGLVMFIAFMAAVIAAQGLPPGGPLLLMLAGLGLASAGASALNQYLDRGLDDLMARTRNRPLAAGRISRPWGVLVAGTGLVALSVPFSMSVNGMVAAYTVSGALVYVVVYTLWLKRRSQLNIIVGGLSGSFAALAGWAVVSPTLSPLPLIIAVLVFLWTPLHFWNFALVHREQYQRAGVPMMPVLVGRSQAARRIFLTAAGMFLLSLAPYFLGYLGPVYLVGALGSGALLWGNLTLLRRPAAPIAWANYKLSGPYLAALFVAMAADGFFL
ncbi:MAG: heme o synthase [Dehalococcoidia bacterium]